MKLNTVLTEALSHVDEAAKSPRKGTVAWEREQQRKKKDRDPEETKRIDQLGNKNHMVGNAKVKHEVNEHIIKHGDGYRLVSKKSGKNLGDFPTKAAAEKHEREVEYFKHRDGVKEGKVSGYKMYSNHDGTWYVEDENEEVVLRNASRGEAEHAVSAGNERIKSMNEAAKPDRYHIVKKDGKPATLASYPNRESAIKDRDEKYPGAVVQRVGPRGKVKSVEEGIGSDLATLGSIAALGVGLGIGAGNMDKHPVTTIQGDEYIQHELPSDTSKVQVTKDDKGNKVYAWVEQTGMKPRYTYHWFAPVTGTRKESVVEAAESIADIDAKIEFHKQGQAAAQYKGLINKVHAAKIKELLAKKEALKKQEVKEGSLEQRIAFKKKNNPLQASVKQSKYGYSALVTYKTGEPAWYGGAYWQTPELAMGHAQAFVKGYPHLEQKYAQRFIDKNRDGLAQESVEEGKGYNIDQDDLDAFTPDEIKQIKSSHFPDTLRDNLKAKKLAQDKRDRFNKLRGSNDGGETSLGSPVGYDSTGVTEAADKHPLDEAALLALDESISNEMFGEPVYWNSNNRQIGTFYKSSRDGMITVALDDDEVGSVFGDGPYADFRADQVSIGAPANQSGTLRVRNEGIGDTIKRGVKSVKRAAQGWGDGVTPKGIKQRASEYSDDEVTGLAKSYDELRKTRATLPTSTDVPKHSPAGLQKRMIDREMKKRRLGEDALIALDESMDPQDKQSKWKVTYDIYGSNRDVPLQKDASKTVYADTASAACAEVKKLVGGRNHKAECIRKPV